ncbi:MAG: PadR family transcriptional regulator [Spirochaetota bacterium]|jgi:DNA-binding PadR family transcriptional regulator|nr:PadR family transcriptional regulator [Spirochaetota bacterium]
MEKITREFFLGFIRIHILHHAAKEPIFGQRFNEELSRHGYEISYGTLYPIFHGLEKEGYLVSEKKNVGGKIRKYYTITTRGKKMLAESMAQIRELVDEVLEDREE